MKNKFLLKLVADRTDGLPDEKDWCPPLDRRAALKFLGVGALTTVAGCGNGSNTTAIGTTKASTTTSLGTSTTSATVGTSITLTAMVAPSAATGSVTFYNGSTSLGSVSLSSGTATLTTSFSSAQTATITAEYTGDSSYSSSTSSALTITVAATTAGTTVTTIALSTSTTATTVGTSVTLTARVTPIAATGTVTFYDGATSIGTGTLSSGNATLTTSFNAAGTESITAVYAGDSTYAGSTSSAVSIAVTSSTSSSCGTSIAAVTEGPYWVTDSASGYDRSDILSDIAGTNTQSGVPFSLTLYVYDAKNSCAALQNVQVDIWHCNAAGVYSGIQSSTNGNGTDYTSQSWLRGYQLTDSTGKVSFTTILPGWYTGRTTHIHIRFRSTYDSSADGSTNTAQLFFDQTFVDTLDTTVSPYSSEGRNSVTNAGDSIYTAEGGTTLLSLSGSASAGYTASFSVYLPLS
ncbi:Ig-like domain repeat protein [Granulicella aggregans]|uniref:Ig-like domain repeat protein n=1 Tax=Granulicella aggregans TaxID=474949 RepID=UPI0021DFC08B|nr:Ig-like domain repeat protein [Granulicella aggregans]